ncbi:class I SAM-dependent methyltransferase [Haloarcula sp. JP-L23]|uniref:class I SAM-dependent methyltransferase n=1 Tax=Haloarcula sp. JP-L23 TaxID=2716717 RepID=UPI001878A0E8
MGRQFDVGEQFRFIGRTFEEYARMFGLAPTALAGTTILDCPGGPGSFTAIAAQRADRTLAVDPMYGRPVGELATVCADAVERTVAQLHEKRGLFVWDEYGDVATRGRYLRAAAQRFLADYARHPGRYVGAALPRLPFATDSVDHVLSGNLLFLYDDRLSERFHVEALLELARIAREDVRVFPLHSLDGERSESLSPVVDTLRDAGRSVRLEPVDYEFQPGATETLVVGDTDGYGESERKRANARTGVPREDR